MYWCQNVYIKMKRIGVRICRHIKILPGPVDLIFNQYYTLLKHIFVYIYKYIIAESEWQKVFSKRALVSSYQLTDYRNNFHTSGLYKHHLWKTCVQQTVGPNKHFKNVNIYFFHQLGTVGLVVGSLGRDRNMLTDCFNLFAG